MACMHLYTLMWGACICPVCYLDHHAGDDAFMHTCRKKAISRAGGISSLAAVLTGESAEGSMYAAQALLHMAKLPDLKVCPLLRALLTAAAMHIVSVSIDFPSCTQLPVTESQEPQKGSP